MNNKFGHTNYLIRRQFLALAGAKFHIFDESGQLVMFSQMKAFKLKEDIRLYSDESKTQELISIMARSVIDFSATYDVVDATTQERIGSLRRKGMKSILKDEWILMNANEMEIGRIKEDGMILALLRRFLTTLIPQKYHVEMDSRVVTTFKQNFNPFLVKLNVDFSLDPGLILDRRLGLAAAVLLCAIDSKQG